LITFAFYGLVTTGLIYSVFTHWGLTKHWWVIGKWLGALSLFALVWIWLGPAINGMTALADAGLSTPAKVAEFRAFVDKIGLAVLVTLIMLSALIAITIFKPWGQHSQAYALRRGVILSLTGFAVVVSVGLGLLAHYDLESFRKMTISTPDLSQIHDGDYQGAVSYAGFQYQVAVRISDHQIIAVQALDNRNSPYARFAEGIFPRVIAQQSAGVDGITGATTTSKILMQAIQRALEGAAL